MKTDPNTPAFAKATENPNLTGLSKREYFAALALEGILAHGSSAGNTGLRAVRYADELIASLNEETKK